MLSISISQPVDWSPAPAPAVAAVSSAAAVTPVQASARDSRTGTGQSGREPAEQSQSARQAGAAAKDRSAEADKTSRRGLEAAPLLPRPQPEGGQGQQSAEAEAEKLEEQKQQQAEEAARKLQLQDVIVSAWKASAAVVDVMLGRETVASVSQAGGQPGDASPAAAGDGAGLMVVAAPMASSAAESDSEAIPAELVEEREVVAYDAQGHSSLAALEAGSLISHHV